MKTNIKTKSNYTRPTRRVIKALRKLGRTSRTALAKASKLDKEALADALTRLAHAERINVSDRFISLAA